MTSALSTRMWAGYLLDHSGDENLKHLNLLIIPQTGWEHRIKPLRGIKMGSPMVVILGQQYYNVGEKPTVIR